MNPLDHLVHGKKVAEVLKNVKGMTPKQIEEEITFTFITGTGLRIHRQIPERTIDILTVSLGGEVTVIK